MFRTNMIKNIYKVLLLYEDIFDVNSIVNETEYISYLNRMYVLFSQNEEILRYIQGLIDLGKGASHANVKSAVFHIIKLIDKGVS